MGGCNSAGKWMPFVRSQERFYRIILGRILRKLTESNVTLNSLTPLRGIIEFGYREPMSNVLRVLSIDARGHTRRLLDKLCYPVGCNSLLFVASRRILLTHWLWVAVYGKGPRSRYGKKEV